MPERIIKVKLTCTQYRQATHDQNVAVPEKKEETFEGTSLEIALAVDRFLEQGAVVCGEVTYKRNVIEAEQVLPLPSVLQPDPAFCPPLDYID